MGLAVNLDLKIFICLTCGYMLEELCPKWVLAHIKHQHPMRRKKDLSLACKLDKFFEKVGIEFAKTADVMYQMSNDTPILGDPVEPWVLLSAESTWEEYPM
jgi:hypothetical protein